MTGQTPDKTGHVHRCPQRKWMAPTGQTRTNPFRGCPVVRPIHDPTEGKVEGQLSHSGEGVPTLGSDRFFPRRCDAGTQSPDIFSPTVKFGIGKWIPTDYQRGKMRP